MAGLVASGFVFVIVAAICLVLLMIGLFVGQIIIFDSIALAIIGGAVAFNMFGLSKFLSIIIGIAVFLILMFLQSTGPGFWIIGGLLSLVWGFIFSLFAFSMSGENMFWTIGVWIVGTIIMILLHLRSRSSLNSY